MAWQKCPVCNGTGKNYEGLHSSAICPTCNGQRIIHEVTGLPPSFTAYNSTIASNTTTDLATQQYLQSRAIDSILHHFNDD